VDVRQIKIDEKNNQVIVPLNIVYSADEFRKVYSPRSLQKGDKEKTFNFSLD
jgi:hypothetical protein